MKLLELTTEQKCSFCIKIVEMIKNKIVDKEACGYVTKALVLAKQWTKKNTNIAYELYDLIDNEEYGFTIYQESEEDEDMIALWNCIIDSFAFICRKAYEEQGTNCYPEPIELVDDTTLIHLVNSFLKCSDMDSDDLEIVIP